MKLIIKVGLSLILALFGLVGLSVWLLTQVGLNAVSGALVENNPQTHQVEIHNPATGKIVEIVSGPFVWPIQGIVTLEFAQSDLPYQPFHTGIDIASPNHQVGDPVTPFMQGIVSDQENLSWGYGKFVRLDNGHHIQSIYAHLNTILVTKGEKVGLRTIIGTRGNTGWSTGPHTHFEIRVFGIPVNPRLFLFGNP